MRPSLRPVLLTLGSSFLVTLGAFVVASQLGFLPRPLAPSPSETHEQASPAGPAAIHAAAPTTTQPPSVLIASGGTPSSAPATSHAMTQDATLESVPPGPSVAIPPVPEGPSEAYDRSSDMATPYLSSPQGSRGGGSSGTRASLLTRLINKVFGSSDQAKNRVQTQESGASGASANQGGSSGGGRSNGRGAGQGASVPSAPAIPSGNDPTTESPSTPDAPTAPKPVPDTTTPSAPTAPAPTPPAPTPTPTPDPSAACTYSSTFSFVSGTSNPPVSLIPKPARGVPYTDPAFSTCVIRLTDHVADNTGGFARNDYSRRQAFNADDTLVIIYGGDGGAWHLYDTKTYRHIKRLVGPGGDAEPQWHPTDPNRLYYIPTNGGLVLYSLSVSTNLTMTVKDFTGRLPWTSAAHVWTKSEGSPSEDGRYWAFMVDDAAWNSLGIFTWDMQSDTILGTLDTHGDRPDNVSMSPSGDFVVAQFSSALHTRAYDRSLTSSRVVDCGPNHSDLVKGADGDDYYVAIDFTNFGDPACSPANGYVFMRNLRTGARTDLFPTYVDRTVTSAHFSGRAFRKPGWFLLSTYARRGSGALQYFHEQAMAVELQANPTVYHLAHHHSLVTTYWAEPHASVNRDFTRITFNSNWGSGLDDIDAYVVELPRW